MIVLGTNHHRYGCLIALSNLHKPIHYTVEGGPSGEIKHDKDGSCIPAHHGQHAPTLPMPELGLITTEIPDAEGNVDATLDMHHLLLCGNPRCLYKLPAHALRAYILGHEAGLARLGVAHNTDFEQDGST
eukprot:c8072_g2_i1 orf=17-406(-)